MKSNNSLVLVGLVTVLYYLFYLPPLTSSRLSPGCQISQKIRQPLLIFQLVSIAWKSKNEKEPCRVAPRWRTWGSWPAATFRGNIRLLSELSSLVLSPVSTQVHLDTRRETRSVWRGNFILTKKNTSRFSGSRPILQLLCKNFRKHLGDLSQESGAV